MLKKILKSKKQNSIKLYRNNVTWDYHFSPFLGIGSIVIEQSNVKEIKHLLGEPDEDYIDSRENRILLYESYGFTFKFLKIFNAKKKNPIVSFITIKKPFIDKNSRSIHPGLSRTDVHFRMNKYHPTEVKGNEEIWKNEEGRKMKFVYDENDKLETMIIY